MTKNNKIVKHALHDNQLACVESVKEALRQGCRWNIVAAETQSGKTGVAIGLTDEFIRNPSLGVTSVYVITALNLRGLREQTLGRFVEYLSSLAEEGWDVRRASTNSFELRGSRSVDLHVLKNSDLDMYRSRPNSAIIIDECHYGVGRQQRMPAFLTRFSVDPSETDQASLEERNMYVVPVSATPYLELITSKSTHTHKRVHRLLPGHGYVGLRELDSRIQQSDPSNKEREFLRAVRDALRLNARAKARLLSTGDRRDSARARLLDSEVFIYRSNSRYSELEFDSIERVIAKSAYDFEFVRFYGEDIDYRGLYRHMHETRKHLCVFVKSTFLMGDTIEHVDEDGTVHNVKRKIRVVYEHKRNQDGTVQALLGRMTGYHRVHPKLTIYANKACQQKAVRLIDSGFEDVSHIDKDPRLYAKAYRFAPDHVPARFKLSEADAARFTELMSTPKTAERLEEVLAMMGDLVPDQEQTAAVLRLLSGEGVLVQYTAQRVDALQCYDMAIDSGTKYFHSAYGGKVKKGEALPPAVTSLHLNPDTGELYMASATLAPNRIKTSSMYAA